MALLKQKKKLWLIFGVYFLFFKSPADPMKTTTIAFASIHEPKFVRSAFELAGLLLFHTIINI